MNIERLSLKMMFTKHLSIRSIFISFSSLFYPYQTGKVARVIDTLYAKLKIRFGCIQ